MRVAQESNKITLVFSNLSMFKDRNRVNFVKTFKEFIKTPKGNIRCLVRLTSKVMCYCLRFLL